MILLILKSQSTILNVSMSIAHNVQIMKYTGRGDSNKHYLIQTQQKTQEPGEGNTNNGKVFVSYPKRRRPSGGGDYSDPVPVICQTLGLLMWVTLFLFQSSADYDTGFSVSAQCFRKDDPVTPYTSCTWM